MSLDVLETRRRTWVKSLVWRLIGIVWTWIGAYFVVLWLPDGEAKAYWAATLIVVYHYSTRMVMYYGYERLWMRIAWGRFGQVVPMSAKEKGLWVVGTVVVLGLIFYLLLVVTPLIKG